MPDLDLPALITFALVTTFSPGPNNIASASLGVLHGYRRTLRFLVGIAIGFTFLMLGCGLVSRTLLETFPALDRALRWVGAAYILWLAFHTYRASYAFEEEERPPLGFGSGLLLQVLNPKAVIYGLTLYATFLASITQHPLYLIISALLLGAGSFTSVSLWALFGSMIRNQLRRPRIRRAVNLVLSLLLVYTAIEVSGLLDAIR
ncbi:MAG: LysE family transporter [Anaerolineae bacterium]